MGNGYCNDETNNVYCFYDGGDCCGACINEEMCSECICYSGSPVSNSTQNATQNAKVGNGFCNDEYNNDECNYDDGDCCGPCINSAYCTECACIQSQVYGNGSISNALVGNGFCNDETNNPYCSYDGGDCCGPCLNVDQCSECVCFSGSNGTEITNPVVGNSICNDETNIAECNFDGGDCCSNPEMVANGFCNDETNTASCLYDGGDCCINVNTDYCLECSCVFGVIKSPGFPQNYYNQIDVTWLIQVAREELIQIAFQSFDVESHSSCR